MGSMHEQSKRHREMLRESAELDLMLGTVRHVRVLTPMQSKGAWASAENPLSKAMLRAHWGSRITKLCEFARERMRSLGHVQLDGQIVQWDPSLRFSLGVVTYDGARYNAGNVCIPYEALPNGHGFGDDDDEGPPDSGGASSSWQVQTRAPAVTVAYPTILEQEAWRWPVVHISRTTTLVRCGGTVVVVVCVYQWMWDRPTGWRLRVVETRSRL